MADNISIDGIAYIVGRIVEKVREAVKESKDDKKTVLRTEEHWHTMKYWIF